MRLEQLPFESVFLFGNALFFYVCLRRLTFCQQPQKVSKKGRHCVKLNFVQCLFLTKTTLTCPRSSHTPPRVPRATLPHTSTPHQLHNGPHHQRDVFKLFVLNCKWEMKGVVSDFQSAGLCNNREGIMKIV